MITVRIDNLPAAQAYLTGFASQVPFATARALTVAAHAVNRSVRDEMSSRIAGGATPYTLRAFAVTAATKASQQAEVGLKTAGQTAATPYERAIGHLFHGGVRRFKRIEDRLRARGIVPPGMQMVPGRAAPIDARGNVRRAALQEMLGVLEAAGRGMQNLRVYRRVGRNKGATGVGFFVIAPGVQSHLAAGIWRRIESSGSSIVEPWFLFVPPGRYAKTFDLEAIATRTVAQVWPSAFSDSLAKAIASAQ